MSTPVWFQQWFLNQSSGNAAQAAYVQRVEADGGVVASLGCVPQAVWDWSAPFGPVTPPFVGLLDLYPNAAAAYSLRKLRAAYSGAAVRVRESGGGTEADIGFTSAGELDTAALLAHCGANDGLIVKWYDQSGNVNRDASQTASAASQPKIVSAGSLVTDNSKAAIDFDGVNDFLNITAGPSILPADGDFSIFSVFSADTSSFSYLYSNRTTTNERHGLGVSFFSSQLRINGSVRVGGVWSIYEEFLATANQQYLVSAFKQNTDLYVDGVKTTGATNGLFAADNLVFNIGANTNNSSFLDGKIQELVFWPSDQSATRTGIETYINIFYSIYP